MPLGKIARFIPFCPQRSEKILDSPRPNRVQSCQLEVRYRLFGPVGRVLAVAVVASLFLGLGAKCEVPIDHAERMAKGTQLFRTEVRGFLVEHCLDCHGGSKTKGDFDLSTRDGLLHSGEDGVAVRPFSAAESRLVKMIRHEIDPNMPKKKPRLPDSVIVSISNWIDLGAPYDAPLVAGKSKSDSAPAISDLDRTWWAFQPLKQVTPPPGASNPIDSFLLRAAEHKGLTFGPLEDRRKLIRRATLDLTGIPPSPEQMDAALADQQPDAWSRFIRRLLDSPQYGERWGRHWLDVARFAESSGFEHDYDRPNAFHYRDFVIKALNSDMPFDQFVRWQLAGDEFDPGNPLALMATGFLGAGVFPTQITANEVERTRYDALDDMLSTTGSAFLGLTVGCARCHDHKYDPIPTRDYYRLLSTFTTTVRANVDLELDPDHSGEVKKQFQDEQKALETNLTAFETTGLVHKFDAWLNSGAAFHNATVSLLDVSSITSEAGATFKKLDDGSWLAEGNNGASDTYLITGVAKGGALTGLKLEALTDPSMKQKGPGRADNGNFALSRISITAQSTAGGPAQEIKLSKAEATHQQNGSSLSVASALDSDPHSGWAVDSGGIGKDQAAVFWFAEPVQSDTPVKLVVKLEFAVNTGHNIGRPRLSFFSGGDPALNAEVVPPAIAALKPLLGNADQRAKLSQSDRSALFAWWKRSEPDWLALKSKVEEHAKHVPVTATPVLVCAEGYPPLVMHSQGPPFLNETHILKRGDVNQKVELAAQGFLQVLSRDANANRWSWAPPAGARYSGRRRSLANWITDVERGGGALMARVAVNRLWQHHFGRGLVATPNDFGKTGAQPSHPELLDWLAGELIRNGWHLKAIHELMMTSVAYQLKSGADERTLASDPDNRLFLRRIPQRLEAEAVRDSVLAVSGLLDPRMFGPGSMDEDSLRRSIYFTVKRSRLMNSMVVFDAPEPLTSQGIRPATTVAPQALLMLNSPQVRRWAESLMTRVVQKQPVDSVDFRRCIDQVYLLSLGRHPRPSELTEGVEFVERGKREYAESGITDAAPRALTDFCHAILGLNEFVYLD
jgi:Protein of unknown function (DUF1553)/Protein of unknown function (DUF1549)/Planctomycete cytochrome C